MEKATRFAPLALAGLLCGLLCGTARAEDVPAQKEASSADATAELARKLQNPLADIRAIMTDNTIGFITGDTEGVSFNFQLQPVVSFDFPKAKFTFIPRAVIPILGLEPGTSVPVSPDPSGSQPGRAWGLSDSILQLFFAPHMPGSWKVGAGPQVSFKTRTNSQLGGPDWGAGIVGILVGSPTPQTSFALILGNHWSFNGEFSSLMLHPMLYYNIGDTGAYFAYNAMISADWKASRRNVWTVPVGISVGRVISVREVHAFEIAVGPYYNVVRPDGAAEWIARVLTTWLFP